MFIYQSNHLVCILISFVLGVSEALTCPQKCTCHNKTTRCGSRGLTDIPQHIPSPTLKLLADNNEISKIPTQMLRGGRSLMILNLQHNNIDSLTVNNFRNIPSLTCLDLSFNNISVIPDNAFLKLERLRTLNLTSNQVSRLYPEAFKELNSLRELFLTDNKIRVLPIDLLTSLPKLATLRLDGNRISTVPDGLFNKLPALGILNLDRNRVRRINLGTFEGLASLQQLHLHNNKIETIDVHLPLPVPAITCDTNPVGNFTKSEAMQLQPEDGVFTKMKQLRLIDLRYNELKTVKVSSFLGLKFLKTLTIAENKWRCNCPLKWNIEKIRYHIWYSSNAEWFGDVHCEEPANIKNVSLDDLNFDDLKSIAKSIREMVTTTKRSKINKTTRMNTNNYDPPTSKSSNSKTSDNDGNRKPVPTHPSVDAVTEYGENHRNKIYNTKSPTWSLIPAIQTSIISSTTSYTSRHHETNGVKPNIKHYTAISYNTTTNTTSNENSTTTKYVIYRNDVKETEIAPTRKIGEKIWLLATVIMLSLFALLACGGLIGQRYFRKRDKYSGCCFKKKVSSSTSTSVRTVSSYPLLYDNHHIARRPLPRAPSFISQSSRLVHNEEVRWTNGGVYGLGSNRSSFVSLQSQATGNNFEISVNTAETNLSNFHRNSSKSKRPNSRRVLSVYDLTENEPLQECSTERLHEHNSVTSTSSKQRLKRTQSALYGSVNDSIIQREPNSWMTNQKEVTKIQNGTTVSCKFRNSTRGLPPVPKRNATSRDRCRELKSHQQFNNKSSKNWSKNAYCEIDPRLPKETSEFVQNILYKKHHCQNGFAQTDSKSDINPEISEFTRRICDRIIQLHAPIPNTTNTTTETNVGVLPDCNTLNTTNQKSEENKIEAKEITESKRKITKDSGYDKLVLCTSGESITVSQNNKKFNNSIYDDSCSSVFSHNTESSTGSFTDPNSMCDSMTTDDDGGSSDGGDDFEIIYPIVESRRTYPLGAFGSDQYILDSLQEQENSAKREKVHHTAPAGLENLTVPLSELSTDEDDPVTAFQLDSPRSKTSSLGSMSTVLAKTPDVENDVFVYTMAGESSDVIPKITLNDEDVFQEDARNGKTPNSDTRYQHIKYMYSGFPKKRLDSKEENLEKLNNNQNNTVKEVVTQKSKELPNKEKNRSSMSSNPDQNSIGNTNFQKYKKRRHYWSIELDKTEEDKKDFVKCKNVQKNTKNLSMNAADLQTTVHSHQKDYEDNPNKWKPGYVSKGFSTDTTATENHVKVVPSSPSNENKQALTSAGFNKHNQKQPLMLIKDSAISEKNYQKQSNQISHCSIQLDENKNPVVRMSSTVDKISESVVNKNQVHDKSKRSSKHIGYFAPADSPIDDDTDEEVFDLGTL